MVTYYAIFLSDIKNPDPTLLNTAEEAEAKNDPSFGFKL